MQVLAEFNLICGDGAAETVREKWQYYVPKILTIGEDEIHNEETQYSALNKVEKLLRPPGAGAKSVPAVSIHEVQCLF